MKMFFVQAPAALRRLARLIGRAGLLFPKDVSLICSGHVRIVLSLLKLLLIND